MKHIQKARVAVQILFALLTALAIFVDLPAFKIIILVSILAGGVFYCGWACPFGFVQDIGSKIGRKIGIKNRHIPDNIHKIAIFMRYILLVLTVGLMTDLLMIIVGYEPRGGFIGLISGRIPATGIMIVITIFILLSLKYDRLYCRYLCTEGARYGVVSLMRQFTIKRDETACISCGKCDRACPMQIKISKAKSMRSPQCINCLQCMVICPIENTLTYGKKPRKIKE